MDVIINFIKIYFAGFFTILVYLIGGMDVSIVTLLIFIVLDYITGMMKGFYNKNLDSAYGFKGVLKKIGELVVVMVAVGIDRFVNTGGVIRELIVYYLVLTEGLSIVENLGAIGVPIPKKFKEALKQLRDEKEKKGKGE